MAKRRDERGVTAMEMIIVTPVLLIAFVYIVQWGLLMHAQNGAKAAAEEGAAVARSLEGSAGQGQATAQRYLNELGSSMFTSTSVTADRSGTTASVNVDAEVVQIFPGLVPSTVRASSSGPVERFVEEEAP